MENQVKRAKNVGLLYEKHNNHDTGCCSSQAIFCCGCGVLAFRIFHVVQVGHDGVLAFCIFHIFC